MSALALRPELYMFAYAILPVLSLGGHGGKLRRFPVVCAVLRYAVPEVWRDTA